MAKRKNGPRMIYDGDKNCFMLGDIEIYELDEFLGLQMRWIETNALASYSEKEEVWSRMVWAVTRYKMYEWKDEYILDYFHTNAKMYLPNQIYNRLMRGAKV
jgi:hypothetical protein